MNTSILIVLVVLWTTTWAAGLRNSDKRLALQIVGEKYIRQHNDLKRKQYLKEDNFVKEQANEVKLIGFRDFQKGLKGIREPDKIQAINDAKSIGRKAVQVAGRLGGYTPKPPPPRSREFHAEDADNQLFLKYWSKRLKNDKT